MGGGACDRTPTGDAYFLSPLLLSVLLPPHASYQAPARQRSSTDLQPKKASHERPLLLTFAPLPDSPSSAPPAAHAPPPSPAPQMLRPAVPSFCDLYLLIKSPPPNVNFDLSRGLPEGVQGPDSSMYTLTLQAGEAQDVGWGAPVAAFLAWREGGGGKEPFPLREGHKASKRQQQQRRLL